LYEVDIPSRSILRNIPIGNTLEGILIYGSRIFVTDVNYNPDNFSFGDGKLYYSDLPELTNWSSVTVGVNPQRMLIGSDGNLHIICTGNYSDTFGAIYVIDPTTVSITDSISIGGSPGYGVLNKNNLVFLGAGGWVDYGEVYCYDGATYEILNGPANPIQTGAGAGGMVTDIYGNVYSCNFMEGTVSKINQFRQVVGTFFVGDGPQVAAYYNPDATGFDDGYPLDKSDLTLTLYPNPFNSWLSILATGFRSGEKLDIRIYNLQGNLVQEFNDVITGGNQIVHRWNGSELASGIYFLCAYSHYGTTQTKLTLTK